MKTIVNKLRFALLLGLAAFAMTALAQNKVNIEKMSITTQMFLDEMAGRITFGQPQTPPRMANAPDDRPLPEYRRYIASPDTIDGKVYISAIVRVTDDSVIDELKAMGVQLMAKFENGLLTANLPVDRIEAIAALKGVVKIDVSSMVAPITDITRNATNADDVLTLSTDAQNAGLNTTYDGSGVILGIIDVGIDFQHEAFKDKNGNSRIKGAYCYNGSSVTADWTGSGTLPTTDDPTGDHGTHTATIAGGSSVIVDGTNVTVTDDHAHATYGGMAPGADLYLAGVRLNTAHILTAFQKMCNYADAQGKPLVVSNSWGDYVEARDGNNFAAEVISQLFGNNHPDRICLFGSANEAGKGFDGVGGGTYVTGPSSQASPLGTIIRSVAFRERSGYQYLIGYLANAWTRATDASGIGINVHVINKNTGALERSQTLTSTNNGYGGTVNVSDYFGYNINVYFEEIYGKYRMAIYSFNDLTTGTDYAIAIEVYPIGGSDSTIDIWAHNDTYFTANVSTSGHNWVYGNDDMSMSDQSVMHEVISVGSYVSRSDEDSNNLGDISIFSSYAIEGEGPLGEAHPCITAPGQVIIAGVNHFKSHNESQLIVNNPTAPYGKMMGTSMATPAAAGIVALWLQAAKEAGKSLNLSEVKTILKETAIRDYYVTDGPSASHFGNGKIDALAGIQYILDHYANTDPVIRPNPTRLNFSCMTGESCTHQVTVNGANLTGNITATLSDPYNVFSMNLSSAMVNGQTLYLNASDVIDVTYSPLATGSHTGTITLTSPGAEPVTVYLNGTASDADADVDEKTLSDGTAGNYYLPIFGYRYHHKQVNQMIYPAEWLTEFQGKRLKSMTFYSPHIYFSGGKFNVKVGTTTQSSYTGTVASIVRLTPDDITPVATDLVAVAGDTTLTITFDENHPFIYGGGNLLVDFEVTETGDFGVNNSDRTIFYGNYENSFTAFNTHSLSAPVNSNGIYTDGGYCGARNFLPKVTIVAEAPNRPSLRVNPAEVNIEDETNDNRSAIVAVTAENLTGALTTTSSNSWSAAMNQDNSEMTVTYHGKALHQVGSASVHSYADNLHAGVTADYLYTGPIYVIGDVNNYYWNTSNGALMSRDGDGVYTVTVTAQQSSDAAYISFSKRLGSNIDGYRFGPVSNGNWWLTNGNEGIYNPLDTVGNVNNIRVTPGTYFIMIDSKNNRFLIRHAVTSSSVSPCEGTLDFGTVTIGSTFTLTVTITNDGDMPFTPSLSGLSGAFSTDYEPTELAPGESVTITITYTPETTEGDSGTFTVSDGVNTYTWTLTGNGSITTSVIFSNEVVVPVYKTDLDVYGPYTYSQVLGDTNRELDGNITNGMVRVQAKNIDAITDYRLFHNAGAQNNTPNMSNWANGNNQNSVAYAVHSVANDNFTTYAKDGNAWAQDAVYTFQNGQEEMWIDLHDNLEVGGNVDTWYVPVTVASSKMNNENTYGSRMEQNPKLNGSVIVNVGYDDSSEHRDYLDPATGMKYVYVTAQAQIIAEIPTIEINGHSYECVMARAWRYYQPYIVGYGTSSDYVLELIGENTEINGETGTVSCVIGSESWTETNDYEGYYFNEYTFCVEEGKQTDVTIFGRLYYKRNDVVDPAPGMLRLSGSDGGYFAMDGQNGMPEDPTSISEYYYDKELVDVTFVNPQGMTSSRPFEGVNIVVKRYSDGSTSTSKVLKR